MDLAGFEPATFRLQGGCSPAELKAQVRVVAPLQVIHCRPCWLHRRNPASLPPAAGGSCVELRRRDGRTVSYLQTTPFQFGGA